MIFLRGLVVWLMFILAESLNGSVRILWLAPALGESRAQQVSFVIGSVLLLAIATLFIRWLRTTRTAQLLGVGVLWLLFTLAFEITLGRVVFGYSWAEIAADFNLLKGELMPIELVLLLAAPFVAVKLRDTLSSLKTTAIR